MKISDQLTTLPSTPGVYLYKDANGHVLYVGKAKLLRHRVRSYFQLSAALDPAKQQMVPQIATIDTISTDTEAEALVLEANLIQQHHPPYNVVLRDDKFYLFIKITKEDFPRVFLTRRLKKDGSRYFGPYSSAQSVRITLKLLRRIFPHRGEKDTPDEWLFPHPLFSQSEKSVRRSPAYPAGGFGEGGLSPAQYHANIRSIIRFLKGERDEVIARLRAGMAAAAARHAFEQASLFRDQLQAIERLGEQQKVYLPTKDTLDIISIAHTASRSAANVFSIRQGKLLSKNTFLLRHRSTATAPDVVRQFLLQYYRVAQDIPPHIVLPVALEDEQLLAEWIRPPSPPQMRIAHRGRLRQLVVMGEMNAKQLLEHEQNQAQTAQRRRQALADLAAALQLPIESLERIETYDISNIQGKLATGSLVVFEKGQPAKQHYKRFRIRLSQTPNDYAMLQEVLARRFAARHQDWSLPGLIMIDGGKGQRQAAETIIRSYHLTIPVIALAKREEELFIPGESQPLRLPYDSPALYLVQRMRDEAHHFTLHYHQLLRSKQQKKSILNEIPGIGPVTRKRLLNHFGSLAAIRQATYQELARIIGSKAQLLKDYL